MLIDCPECKQQVSDKAKVCPNCGYKLHKSIAVKLITAIAIVVLAIVGMFIIANTIKDSKLNEDEQAAYTIMMQVCNKADYPAEVKLLECAVTKSEDTGVYDGFFKVTASGKQYYVCAIYKEDGYELQELDKSLEVYVEELFDKSTGVDEKKVQKKIDKYYSK